MDYFSFDCSKLPATVNISHFKGQSGTDEYHLIVRPVEYANFDTQLEWVHKAYKNALESLGLNIQTAILRRFFCSDLTSQAKSLEAHPFSNPQNTDEPCAVSWVCQPPAPPVKVALWAYHIGDQNGKLNKKQNKTTMTLKRNGLSHHWTAGITCPDVNTSSQQTQGIFEKYETSLQLQGMSLADNAIRTWLFVQNIDSNYQGMAAARKDFFANRGLTPDTHFIASTGVEGSYTNAATKVAMDAYAISGVRPEQIEFLSALDHLSPTYLYGVTFERGTSVAYRDRKHVILSGTASIDHQGKILYPDDVSKQLDRTIENMEALLKQAGAALKDMCAFIVYIRDGSDHAIAWQKMRQRFGNAPIEVVIAPVCRPGWLIEVEGMAVISASNPKLPAF